MSSLSQFQFFDDVEGQPVTVTVDGVKKKTKEEGVKPHVIYETVRSALPVAPAMPTCFMVIALIFHSSNFNNNCYSTIHVLTLIFYCNFYLESRIELQNFQGFSEISSANESFIFIFSFHEK